ncbi:hypothetical protein J3R30DRAFT_3819823 [Lentinula aciculospora]|uniref:Uncharacterized protein n=1 Tax=Lentinula aciculospora TaxID=153920 RepID=A0A9W9DVF7_9AGAR|nr:hypothetical protein J3R30DRAFT_3819823 [Lentinula aciculospora]
MHFHHFRFAVHLVLALVLISVVSAAAVPGHSSATTDPAVTLKITRAVVRLPGEAPQKQEWGFDWSQTKFRSNSVGSIKQAAKVFLNSVIEHQFELGDLEEKDFEFQGYPSQKDNMGNHKFSVTLSFDNPKQNWEGTGAVRLKKAFGQASKLWGKLYNTEGKPVAEVANDAFNMTLYSQGRKNLNLANVAGDVGGANNTP